jgi:hypothetical protein
MKWLGDNFKSRHRGNKGRYIYLMTYDDLVAGCSGYSMKRIASF